MSNEGDLDKRKVNLRIRIETIRKAIKSYAHEGDNGDAPALIRALEFATEDVALTEAEYKEVADEVRRNRESRMEARLNKKGAK